MAILAQRLDYRIESGAVRTVLHPSRLKVYAADGKLTQAFPSQRIKHLFDVSHGVRTEADYLSLIGAFYSVMGGAYSGLLFRDLSDYAATQANSTLTYISGTNWQLGRGYAFGAVSYVRKITRPVNTGSLTVYRTRATVVTTASASITYTTGVADITGHVAGDTYTWAGEFDVPVTFQDNEWRASLAVNTLNLHMINEPVILEEVLE